MINVQNIVLLILQLDHTRSYSIIIDLGSSLYALSNNLFVMFGAVKVSKILKVSEVQWQRLTWLEIVAGSKASLPQSRQPQNLQRWQWVIADRPQRSRHVCHPVGWMKQKFKHLFAYLP